MSALNEVVRLAVAAAVAKERQRCAWIADQYADGSDGAEVACRIGDEIRGVAECTACGKRAEVAETTQAMRDGEYACESCATAVRA